MNIFLIFTSIILRVHDNIYKGGSPLTSMFTLMFTYPWLSIIPPNTTPTCFLLLKIEIKPYYNHLLSRLHNLHFYNCCLTGLPSLDSIPLDDSIWSLEQSLNCKKDLKVWNQPISLLQSEIRQENQKALPYRGWKNELQSVRKFLWHIKWAKD